MAPKLVRRDVVVSLTTHGRRIAGVHKTIRSLLSQNESPGKIWLHVDADDEARIPSPLRALAGDVFEIRICEDVRSYTKLVPAMTALRGRDEVRWLVICDDDVVYPKEWLAEFQLGERDEGEAVAHRCHLVCYTRDGNFMRYSRWKKCAEAFAPSEDPFPTGSGGIAIPHLKVNPFFFETLKFLEWAPTSDDVWVYFMLKYSGVKLAHSGYTFSLREWPLFRADRLYKVNREPDEHGMTPNDRAMLRCREELAQHFGYLP